MSHVFWETVYEGLAKLEHGKIWRNLGSSKGFHETSSILVKMLVLGSLFILEYFLF